jgi:hypothetical protein
MQDPVLLQSGRSRPIAPPLTNRALPYRHNIGAENHSTYQFTPCSISFFTAQSMLSLPDQVTSDTAVDHGGLTTGEPPLVASTGPGITTDIVFCGDYP